jgi:hypothetical protein
MDDLASDVESLPGVLASSSKADTSADLATTAGDPSPLRSVVAGWAGLPEPVRRAIVAMCSA